jgi:hypothetical protein
VVNSWLEGSVERGQKKEAPIKRDHNIAHVACTTWATGSDKSSGFRESTTRPTLLLSFYSLKFQLMDAADSAQALLAMIGDGDVASRRAVSRGSV